MMTSAMASRPPFRFGQPPPIRVDCLLHAGQVLPCPICLDWLGHGRPPRLG